MKAKFAEDLTDKEEEQHSIERVIYDQTMKLGRKAAAEETLRNYFESSELYKTGLLLLQHLVSSGRASTKDRAVLTSCKD